MKLNSFEDIQAAVQKAEEQRSQGNLRETYNTYLTILAHRLSMQVKLIDADMVVIKSLADLAILFGNFQAADDLLTGTVGLYEKAGEFAQADFALLKRIHLAIDRNSLHQADEFLHRMAPRIGDIRTIQFSTAGLMQWEKSCYWANCDGKDRTVLFAQLYLVMGRLLCSLGQYAQALMAFKRGLIHTDTEAPSLARQVAIPFQLMIARAYLEKGAIAQAKSSLDLIQTELSQTQQPEYSVRWLEISGKMNLLGGEFGKALQKFEQVREICQNLKAQRAILQGTLNLVNVLILLNQTSLAKNYLVHAQEEAQSLGEQTLIRRVNLLIRLAYARSQSLATETGLSVSQMRKGMRDNIPYAIDEEQENFALINQSSNYLAFFEDRALAFQWQLSDLNLVGAGNILSHIQEVFRFSDSDLIQVKIKVLEGMLAYYQGVENQGKPTAKDSLYWAASILNDLRPPLIAMGLKPELWQVQRILGWCLARLQRPIAEQDALAMDTKNLLTQLTESLAPEDQAIYLLNKWTADEEYIATKINQLQRLQHRLLQGSPLLRPWRRLSLMFHLHRLMEHIDRYKDALAKQIIQGQKDEAIEDKPLSSLWQRLWRHQKHRVTLSFLVLPDRVFVVRFWKFFLDFFVLPTTRLEVRNVVQHWHQQVQSLNRSRNLAPRDLSATPDDEEDEDIFEKDVPKQLSELLKIDFLLQDLPKNIKALTIVPDDILHGFPFAAIQYQNQFLIEHYALSIAYETNCKRIAKPHSRHPQKALVVGISQGSKGFSPLPAVKDELPQVANWLSRHGIRYSLLKNQAAQKVPILAQLLDTTLLHLACHGTFKPNQPDESGLVLLSADGNPDILTLRELSNLDLTPIHHVTFSSCWAADHFILPGRWVISLPETLWRSGVTSILGCQWEVYDQVAPSIMQHFYQYLDQFPPDQALQHTQIDCIKSCLPGFNNKDTSKPIYWAGFNLYGEPSRFLG